MTAPRLKTATLAIFCWLCLQAGAQAKNDQNIIDIRPLEKDIRNIEGLKPLRTIKSNHQTISTLGKPNINKINTDAEPSRAK